MGNTPPPGLCRDLDKMDAHDLSLLRGTSGYIIPALAWSRMYIRGLIIEIDRVRAFAISYWMSLTEYVFDYGIL